MYYFSSLQFSSRANPSFSNGSMVVPVDSEFPLEEAEKAHARMKENKNIGKIILTL